MRETWVRSLGWEDTLEKRKATHSNILAWRIPWTVQFTGVTKSWTQLSNFHFQGFPGGSDGKESACNMGGLGLILGLERCRGQGCDNPLQYSCLENPHGQRSLQSMGSKRVRHQRVTQHSKRQHILVDTRMTLNIKI